MACIRIMSAVPTVCRQTRTEGHRHTPPQEGVPCRPGMAVGCRQYPFRGAGADSRQGNGSNPSSLSICQRFESIPGCMGVESVYSSFLAFCVLPLSSLQRGLAAGQGNPESPAAWSEVHGKGKHER